MKELTRKEFNNLCTVFCENYGCNDVSDSFSISPSVAQRLQNKIVEQSTLLGKINVIPVEELEGENILGSCNSPLASRTDLSNPDNERKPRCVLGLESYKFKLVEIDSDASIEWKKLDIWAKFKDLQSRYTSYVQKQIATDRETIGWYGTHAAKSSDLSKYPMLQDIAPGWFQYARDNRPESILTECVESSGAIKIGKGGDYLSIRHAVHDLVQLIPKHKREELVVLVGDELLNRDQSTLIQAVTGTPTEMIALDHLGDKAGKIPIETPAKFPDRGLAITSYENLSIYYQEDSWRRHIVDNPKRKQVEDYNSRNEGYLLEDPEQFAALEHDNVLLPDGNGGWA